MVVLCSALIVAGLQSFLNSLYVKLTRGLERPATWPWRWTFMLYACFWFLFAIVMGSAGVMRQTTWLINFTEPLYTPRVNGYVELRQATAEVETALLESKGDIQQAERLLMSFRRNAPGAWDYHQFVFLPKGDNHTDIAIIPRDPELQRKTGFLLLEENDQRQLPMSQLLAVLRGNASAHGNQNKQ